MLFNAKGILIRPKYIIVYIIIIIIFFYRNMFDIFKTLQSSKVEPNSLILFPRYTRIRDTTEKKRISIIKPNVSFCE